MDPAISRRRALSALAAGSVVAIAGCGEAKKAEGTETPNSNGGNEDYDVQQPEEALLIPTGDEYVIRETEKYNIVEIESGGVLQLEPNGCLEIQNSQNYYRNNDKTRQ